MARRESTVAAQVMRWQIVVVLLLVIGGTALAWLDARRDSDATARARSLDVASAVAASPTVMDAVDGPDPSATLQPYAERVRRATQTDFVVVMSTDGTRYTHTDPRLIGQTFRGHTAEALAGQQDFTERYTGSLGPSIRSVVPVVVDGRVRALVSVGITTQKVDRQVVEAIPRILLAAGGVGLLGVAGGWLVSRRLRRQTHGLGEHEITRMYEYYDAVLRSVREGLLLVDTDGRLTLVNDEARRLLDLADDDAAGRHVTELGLEPGLARSLAAAQPLTDDVQVVGDRTLVINQSAAEWEGRTVGTVVTLRDRTELQGVTAELDTVQGLARALRAQNHEASNRMHTIVSLIEIGRADDAVEFALGDLDLARTLTDQVVSSVDEPLLEALLLGKSAEAAERGVRLELSPDSRVTGLVLTPHETVTVVGNLLDNAIDATRDSDRAPRVEVTLSSTSEAFELRVEDSGPGIAPEHRAEVFARGWSTKPDATGAGRGIGLDLVGQVVRRHRGSTDVGTSDLGGARLDVTIGRRT